MLVIRNKSYLLKLLVLAAINYYYSLFLRVKNGKMIGILKI